MKLDLLYEIQPKVRPWDLAFPYGQRKAEQEAFDEAIEQIQLADRLGFNTAWVVEHHFRDGRSACPASEVVLGGLALSTSQIRLGFGVTLLPFGFIHPARVAEKVATVDVLSHGRVEWGTGRSTPMEQAAFGVPIDDRSRDQWKEAIQIVVAMWRQERFSYESENLSFPERLVTPKPYQDPHPPVWQAATSDSSAVSAGRYGLGLLSLSLSRTVEQMADVIGMYHHAQADCEPLTDVRNDRVGAYTLVHCCDDLDVAVQDGLWESVQWWYRNLAEFTIEWELPHLSKEDQERAFPLLNVGATSSADIQRYQDQDMIIIGTPEMCLEKILRYEEAGVDQLLCYMQFGMLSHEKVMRSVELLGTQVLPELERRGHRVNVSGTVPATLATADAGH